MTVYKRPGVYINESLAPLAQTVSVPGASTAAFVGTAKQGGPTNPTFVTSFAQYTAIFGGFGDTSDLLPFAVYQYFNNGGSGCYVVRAVASDATTASVTLMDTETTPAATLKVSAISAGAWGDNLYIDIVPGASGSGRFDLYVYQGGTTTANLRERFLGLSLDPADARNAIALVNSPQIGSKYVTLSSLLATTYAPTHAPASVTGQVLSGGGDGVATVDLGGATQTLGNIEGNLLVNVPGVSDATTLNPLITWAQGLGNVFMVIDGVKALTTDTAATYTTSLLNMTTGGSALSVSSYAAVYGPWLLVNDPATLSQGSVRILPPGGAVLGQYARTDATRGVQKPPAGVDTVLRGVIDVQFRFTPSQLDSLNVAGLNAIKVLPGTGFVIYGARTLSVGLPDRYVSVRRSLMLVEQGILQATKFANFEPNDSILWDQVNAVVSQYLMTLFQSGVLAGTTPSQAYFVVCDSSNNTPATVQSGVVNVQVGVAVSSPAEFIVINLGLMSGGDSTAGTAA